MSHLEGRIKKRAGLRARPFQLLIRNSVEQTSRLGKSAPQQAEYTGCLQGDKELPWD